MAIIAWEIPVFPYIRNTKYIRKIGRETELLPTAYLVSARSQQAKEGDADL